MSCRSYELTLSGLLRTANPELVVGHQHKRSFPGLHRFSLKQSLDAPDQGLPAGNSEAHEQETVVSTWSEAAEIGEIQILRDKKASSRLDGFPDLSIVPPRQAFLRDGIGLVSQLNEDSSQPGRQVLVQFDLHEMLGMLGTGRSSSAEAAANAITARTSRSVRVGKSARIS